MKRHFKSIAANRIIHFIPFILEFDLARDLEENKLYLVRGWKQPFSEKEKKNKADVDSASLRVWIPQSLNDLGFGWLVVWWFRVWSSVAFRWLLHFWSFVDFWVTFLQIFYRVFSFSYAYDVIIYVQTLINFNLWSCTLKHISAYPIVLHYFVINKTSRTLYKLFNFIPTLLKWTFKECN